MLRAQWVGIGDKNAPLAVIVGEEDVVPEGPKGLGVMVFHWLGLQLWDPPASRNAGPRYRWPSHAIPNSLFVCKYSSIRKDFTILASHV